MSCSIAFRVFLHGQSRPYGLTCLYVFTRLRVEREVG